MDRAWILPVPQATASTKLLGTASTTAIIVQREDGYERRYVLDCSRCGLTLGYWLDWAQFDGAKTGRREDVVYLLPKGLVGTDEMVQGNIGDESITMDR